VGGGSGNGPTLAGLGIAIAAVLAVGVLLLLGVVALVLWLALRRRPAGRTPAGGG
jgi:site-specific recombinase